MSWYKSLLPIDEVKVTKHKEHQAPTGLNHHSLSLFAAKRCDGGPLYGHKVRTMGWCHLSNLVLIPLKRIGISPPSCYTIRMQHLMLQTCSIDIGCMLSAIIMPAHCMATSARVRVVMYPLWCHGGKEAHRDVGRTATLLLPHVVIHHRVKQPIHQSENGYCLTTPMTPFSSRDLRPK